MIGSGWVAVGPPRWWQLGERMTRRRARRWFPGCEHLHPTYGDERAAYGLRCGLCFVRIEPRSVTAS